VKEYVTRFYLADNIPPSVVIEPLASPPLVAPRGRHRLSRSAPVKGRRDIVSLGLSRRSWRRAGAPVVGGGSAVEIARGRCWRGGGDGLRRGGSLAAALSSGGGGGPIWTPGLRPWRASGAVVLCWSAAPERRATAQPTRVALAAAHPTWARPGVAEAALPSWCGAAAPCWSAAPERAGPGGAAHPPFIFPRVKGGRRSYSGIYGVPAFYGVTISVPSWRARYCCGGGGHAPPRRHATCCGGSLATVPVPPGCGSLPRVKTLLGVAVAEHDDICGCHFLL
jgi:hypothetical protein